jgi:hypothetical protein
MLKTHHLRPIHTGGTASTMTNRIPGENKPPTWTADGRRTEILMAANPELSGRLPVFLVATSTTLVPLGSCSTSG